MQYFYFWGERYLTFINGLELNEALELIMEVKPDANPSIAAWEEVNTFK